MKARWAAAVLLLALSGVLPTDAQPGVVTTPRVLFAQRTGLLYLKVFMPEFAEDSLRVGLNDTHLSVAANGADTKFFIHFQFFRRVEPLQSEWTTRSGEVHFTIQKKWEWRYWPRLLREKKGEGDLWDFIGVDWRRWKSEDEEKYKTGPEDDDWLDEDFALKKEAHFPLEEWDDHHMPLLNNSNIEDWLEGKETSTVLFFDRANRKNMQMHALYSSVAHMLVGVVPFARVDKNNNMALVKKLHVNNFPTGLLFLGTGETIPYDPSGFKRGREVVDYLYRQTQPAWRDLHNSSHAEAFLTNFSRATIGIFDQESAKKGVLRKAKQFDYLARAFRARLDVFPIAFGRINASLWERDDFYKFTARYPMIKPDSPFTGMLMDKQNDDTHFFRHRWNHLTMSSWIYTKQFNYLEHLSAGNVNDLRGRKKPIVYIMLDDAQMSYKDFLEDAKERVGKKYYGQISLVWTRVSKVTPEIIETLRCDYQGQTYAVLEDLEQEYLYCAVPSSGKNLTVDRIDKLVQGYLEQTIDPDKVKSEPIPKKNPGPLFAAVADNLMETVMQPDADVVIHFYSRADDSWDDHEFELEKYAEAMEDVKTLKVYKFEGMRNERPVEFPDLGYFPCTWMFPMYDKYAPRGFNASAGLTSQRLLWWTHYASSYPLAESQLPRKLSFGTGSPLGWNGGRPLGDTPMAELLKKERDLRQMKELRRVFSVLEAEPAHHAQVDFYDKPDKEGRGNELGDGADGKHQEGQEGEAAAAAAAETVERTRQVFSNVRAEDGTGLTPGSKPKEVKEEL